MSKKQRIDKVLSNLGYGSRSELKKICKNGLVKVNGKVINNPGVQVDVENDEIIFDGEKVTYKTGNIKIATVSSKGQIKARGKGTTIITVTSGKKSVKCKITVR